MADSTSGVEVQGADALGADALGADASGAGVPSIGVADAGVPGAAVPSGSAPAAGAVAAGGIPNDGGMQHGWTTALRLGMRLALARLRHGRAAAVVLLALLATLAVTLIERQVAPSGALTSSLMAVARWAIPLSCFAFVNIARGGQRLDDALWPLARMGISRRFSGLGLMLAVVVLAASLALACAAVVLAVQYDRVADMRDALASLWVPALGASAYVSLLWLAAGWGRQGGYVWGLLAADFLLGAGHGLLALPFPRSHLRSLLGGARVFQLAQPTSSMLLLLMAALGVLLAAQLMRD